MDNTQLEIRNITGNITRSDDSRHVEGYALVFDSFSQDMGGFFEIIDRSAVTPELINSCDVFALLNHDNEKVLARAKNGNGSLTLRVDDKGLFYSFDAPKTALGDELLEYLTRGDITGSSFAFYVDWNEPGVQTWETKNGIKYRTIHKISYIHDVSPVFTPAYTSTSVAKRTLDYLTEQEEQYNKALQLLDEASDDLNKLYDKYIDIL